MKNTLLLVTATAALTVSAQATLITATNFSNAPFAAFNDFDGDGLEEAFNTSEWTANQLTITTFTDVAGDPIPASITGGFFFDGSFGSSNLGPSNFNAEVIDGDIPFNTTVDGINIEQNQVGINGGGAFSFLVGPAISGSSFVMAAFPGAFGAEVSSPVLSLAAAPFGLPGTSGFGVTVEYSEDGVNYAAVPAAFGPTAAVFNAQQLVFTPTTSGSNLGEVFFRITVEGNPFAPGAPQDIALLDHIAISAQVDSFVPTFSPVPEPSTIIAAISAVLIAGIVFVRARRRRA